MPTYVYETIPQFEGEPAKRFEIRQSMKDAALTQHCLLYTARCV